MFSTNRMKGTKQGIFDVAQKRVDPLKGRMLCSLTAAAGDQRHMPAVGGSYPSEAMQPIGDHLATR